MKDRIRVCLKLIVAAAMIAVASHTYYSARHTQRNTSPQPHPAKFYHAQNVSYDEHDR